MKELRKHSFLVLLLMSVAVVSIAGFICGTTEENSKDKGQNVAVATAVHYLKDKLMRPEIPDVVPVSIVIGEDERKAGASEPVELEEKTDHKGQKEETDQKENPKEKNEAENGESSGEKEDLSTEDQGKESDQKDDIANPDFRLVDESYFDDALFIGDSRVVGFGLYSGLQNTAFYANKGFQIYTFQTKQIVDTPIGKITVPEALLLQQGLFKKVYIMFGLNEMGWGTDEQFAQYYYNVIDTVKGTQPDAVIYVQSIMHVTKNVSDTSTVYSNEMIDERNRLIKKIAEDEHVYYLNLNEIFTNEENALPDEFSGDGVHLKAAYIELWKQYLMAHGIVKEDDASSNKAASSLSGEEISEN
ncbi:hypothetical protein D7X88_11575 [bacterium C-53]|nr:hypothetical protein [Lachnospiraceae bacterium]NBI03668.1 hypothetical protein [Lachnospiraceae bacterium]RKJ09228.1 hypothetical protein D7X88_11575 [bacterium C-53]